ncbi:protein kinase domain-containing protein [Actinoplanes rectilineatus]|uniref:protein kinase domain-containing protein n=1 Tax=Actinoplanes rectilineatus TaxID=113571 RepID=UPI00069843AD|nr:protein kinase [Actinoplanes rectilineatus]
MNDHSRPRYGPLQHDDPRQIGAYEVIGRLGSGGMGVVYLARDRTGRQVAVKVIHAVAASDPVFRSRFRDEVASARQVPPFCTAEVLDADPDAPHPYLVVEYVDGPTLGEAVRTNGPLTAANLHGLAIGVATALAAIHGAGVIHRDLKPGNVLLAPGSPKVIDFGIARALEEVQNRHTRTGIYMGTINYMAPERFDGPATAITPAADIFAWGCVVAFAGTGKAPFEAGSPMATMARIISRPPDLAGLPDGPLRRIVEQALSPDPARRPTAQELLARLLGSGSAEAFAGQPDLRSAAMEVGVPRLEVPTGPTEPSRPPRPARSRWAMPVLVGAVVVLLLALGGAVGLIVNSRRPVAQPGALPPPAPASSSSPSLPPSPSASPSRSATSVPPSPAVTTAPSKKKNKTNKTTAPADTDGLPPIKAAAVRDKSYGPFFVQNATTGFCIDLPDFGPGTPDGPVRQDVCHPTFEDNQEFRFVPRGTDGSGDQLYWIRNAVDSLCLDVPGAGTVEHGTPVTETYCVEDDNQDYRLEFRFTSQGRRYHRIVNAASGLCLDVFGTGDGGPATGLTLATCVTGDDHEWALITKSRF